MTCNMDCFNCPYQDCINDDLTLDEIKTSKVTDREISQTDPDRTRKREANRRYREKNLERIREYDRQRYKARKDKVNAYNRKYYQDNKAEISQYDRARYLRRKVVG